MLSIAMAIATTKSDVVRGHVSLYDSASIRAWANLKKIKFRPTKVAASNRIMTIGSLQNLLNLIDFGDMSLRTLYGIAPTIWMSYLVGFDESSLLSNP